MLKLMGTRMKSKQDIYTSWEPWLTPVILATQETEIRRIAV
jgi:hypothetical protein